MLIIKLFCFVKPWAISLFEFVSAQYLHVCVSKVLGKINVSNVFFEKQQNNVMEGTSCPL